MSGIGMLMRHSPLGMLSSGMGFQNPYGAREDMTPKANGFMGMLSRPDGMASSELSFDFDANGKNILAPLLVPTLNPSQIQHLLGGGAPTDEIYQAAQDHAMERIKNGLSPFASNSEIPDNWR